MKLTCAIVDDDESIVLMISSWLQKLSDVEVVGTFSDSLSCMEFLRNTHVDFLLLDVELGDSNGFNLLSNLTTPPQVIILTAHKRYALQGFDFQVADYIMKPTTPERLARAVERVAAIKRSAPEQPAAMAADNLMVKENRRIVRIRHSDILFVEANRDYVKVVTADGGTINTKSSFSTIADGLPGDRFLRIHRSFTVNVEHIDAFSHEGIEMGPHKIPFGRLYREDSLRVLKKMFGVS